MIMTMIALIVGFAILFGVVSSAVFLTSNLIGSRLLGLQNGGNSSAVSSDKISNGTSLSTSSSVVTSDVSDVVEKVMPSIVSITSMSVEEVQSFFGGTYEQKSEGAGTGIIIGKNDTELLIVTNNHVVSGSDTLTVSFDDETSVEAYIKGTDVNYDVAVISVSLESISEDTMSQISVATLGDSTNLRVGEPAIAIGNALGYGQSVTGGYISAVNREVQMTDNTMTLIQTDAAINPGNSGGALLNSKGELIGINTVKYSSTDVEGMGYAIPINTAKPIIEQLIANEAPSEDEQSYLGISGQTVDSSMASQFDMPTGVYVQQVVSGSPAETAGISAGDIITKFNGSTVSTMDGLQSRMSNLKAGTKVEVVVQRQNQQGTYESKTVTVTLGKKSDAPSTSSSDSSSGNSGSSSSQNGSGSGYGSYYSR